VVRGHAPAFGSIEAEILLRGYLYRIDASIPLRPGATMANDDRRLTVAGVERTTHGLAVLLRHAYIQAFDKAGSTGDGIQFVLRNRARREAVFVTEQQANDIALTIGLGWGRPGTGLRRFEFDGSAGPRHDSVSLTDEWIGGAELVVLTPEDLGTFTRPLQVLHVSLGAGR
jgi:hypothetical protein